MDASDMAQCDKQSRHPTDERDPCSECRHFGGEKRRCSIAPNSSYNDHVYRQMLVRGGEHESSFPPSSVRAIRVPCQRSVSRRTGKARVQKHLWLRVTSYLQACEIVRGPSRCQHVKAPSAPKARDISPTKVKGSRNPPLCHQFHSPGN